MEPYEVDNFKCVICLTPMMPGYVEKGGEVKSSPGHGVGGGKPQWGGGA